MRWRVALLVLMLAIALSSIPTLRSNIRGLLGISKFSPTRLSWNNFHSRNITSYLTRLLGPSQNDKMTTTTTTTETQPPTAVPATPVEAEPQTSLPKLSHADFQLYNKMAVMMDYYHNHFRHTWNTIYTSCTTNTRPKGMSIPNFLSLITQFTRSLTAHHTIEERHIFPVLAVKMPQFREDADMLTQHEGIHAGIEKLEAYVREVRRGDRELRLNDESEGSLKAVMDGFGGVLWKHLDAEVRNLGAENMRLYWTRGEMEGFNF